MGLGRFSHIKKYLKQKIVVGNVFVSNVGNPVMAFIWLKYLMLIESKFCILKTALSVLDKINKIKFLHLQTLTDIFPQFYIFKIH